MNQLNIQQLVEMLAERSSSNVSRDDGDYTVGGLLYCGKCHTPKQARIELMGSILEPYCLCKCAKEEYDRQRDEERKRQRAEEIRLLRKNGIPDRDLGERCTFENDDMANPKASNASRAYVEHFRDMWKKGKGLIFCGGVGTGKTFLAVCIANALIDLGYPCFVTNFARLSNTIFGMEKKQDYIDSLNNYDLLVIDDLAAERDTDFMNEMVTNIIDSRYRAGLPLVVTTNLSVSDLAYTSDPKKQRVYSRLMEMCIPIEMKGQDRRKAKLKEDYNEFKEMLGL